MNHKGNADEVSDGNKDFICNWTRGHPCYTVTMNLYAFYSCPSILWEAEFKSDGLVYVVEISREESIQAMT